MRTPSRNRRRVQSWGAATLLLCLGSGAGAVTVDGIADPDYGAALSVQTTQTSFGDFPADFTGSELDAAYGRIEGNVLYLLIAGNFDRFFSEPLTFATQLQLYVDSRSGGQNPLSASNTSAGFYVKLQDVAGLAFDTEFVPDFWIAGARDETVPKPFFVHYSELPTGSGGTGYFVGNAGFGAPGTIDGGSNPFGILCSIDLSNTTGVTAGCGASSGAGVTTGVEWAIPLAAIGNPTGAIRICALIARIDGAISNQVLGPVPPGTCTLWPAGAVNFASIAGAQYFVVDLTTPTARGTWGRLKTIYR